MYAAFLLAASVGLAWDGGSGTPGYRGSYGGYYGGSYGGLENGYDPASAAAWAPWTRPPWAPSWTGGCGSTCWGGSGSSCGREHSLTRLGERIHRRQDGAPPDRGNAAFSCDSCSFAGSGETWSEYSGCGPGGVPDLGAPAVAPTPGRPDLP